MNVEAQLHRVRDLVDVLSTGALRTDGREGHLRVVGGQCGVAIGSHRGADDTSSVDYTAGCPPSRAIARGDGPAAPAPARVPGARQGRPCVQANPEALAWPGLFCS